MLDSEKLTDAGGLWLPVSELAITLNVSKQAVSKRLKGFGGQVPTRKRGRELLVDVRAYNSAAGMSIDPAQMLRNRALADRPVDTNDRSSVTADYTEQKTRLAAIDVQLAQIKLDEAQGRVVPVRAVEDSMVRLAHAMVREIEKLPQESDDPVMRQKLKVIANRLRDTLSRNMTLAAEAAQEDEAGSDGQTP